MRSADKFRRGAQAVALSGTFCAAVLLAGCGLPAAPQPPSLHLPETVKDLSTHRMGNQVSLTWTMPTRDTSKVALKPGIAVAARICRTDSPAAGCATVANLAFPPGANGTYTEALPPALTTGSPRPLGYFVELSNRKGRSAGLSNAATALAGEAPAPVSGLTAEVRKDGIVLRWTPAPAEPQTEVRLERELLTPAPAKPPLSSPSAGPLAAPAETVHQDLLVSAGGMRGVALDKDVRLGEMYSYRAQRIVRVTLNGEQMELDGPLSPPLRVDAANVFPPPAPAGLAAVATLGEKGAGPSIDLSWQPVNEPDLAGYAVYRREVAPPEEAPAPWQRISGAQPVVGPGFHDPNVQPGHTYEYTVTAIGQNGHESPRSAPAQDTVPE